MRPRSVLVVGISHRSAPGPRLERSRSPPMAAKLGATSLRARHRSAVIATCNAEDLRLRPTGSRSVDDCPPSRERAVRSAEDLLPHLYSTTTTGRFPLFQVPRLDLWPSEGPDPRPDPEALRRTGAGTVGPPSTGCSAGLGSASVPAETASTRRRHLVSPRWTASATSPAPARRVGRGPVVGAARSPRWAATLVRRGPDVVVVNRTGPRRRRRRHGVRAASSPTRRRARGADLSHLPCD